MTGIAVIVSRPDVPLGHDDVFLLDLRRFAVNSLNADAVV